jgi:succinyl-CoA synthetase alpha subunit
MGHAGAWAAPGEPDAETKYQALERAGAVMVNHPEKFGEGMKALFASQSRPGTSVSVFEKDPIWGILTYPQPMSGTSSQKRGFHTMRRVMPISRPTANKRNLYIKQFQAFDILKQKSVPVNESASSSDSSISVSITVDRTALSPCIIASRGSDINPAQPQKFPFAYTQTKFENSIISAVASHLSLPASAHKQLARIVQALWEIYKEKEAFTLETRIGISADGALEVHGARFGFDDAAFRSSGRQEDIHKLRNISEEVPEEVEAEKDGIVYVKYVEAPP